MLDNDEVCVIFIIINNDVKIPRQPMAATPFVEGGINAHPRLELLFLSYTFVTPPPAGISR